LYELFGNKIGLLSALVRERCEAIAAVVEGVAIAALPLREALCTVGRHLVAPLTDPSSIALFRIIIAEASRQPELGRRFYEAGPEPGRRIMAGFLASQTAQGALDIDDPDEAALFFFHMLVGDYQTRLLCGLPAARDANEIDRHIGRTVDAFLRLYAPH
jgi:AcrR family transcriptional regulator